MTPKHCAELRAYNVDLVRRVRSVECPRCNAIPNEQCRGNNGRHIAGCHYDRHRSARAVGILHPNRKRGGIVEAMSNVNVTEQKRWTIDIHGQIEGKDTTQSGGYLQLSGDHGCLVFKVTAVQGDGSTSVVLAVDDLIEAITAIRSRGLVSSTSVSR